MKDQIKNTMEMIARCDQIIRNQKIIKERSDAILLRCNNKYK
jgi:hypothetical protein